MVEHGVKQTNIAGTIKRVIRSHTSDTPAVERDVKAELREELNDLEKYKRACDVFERLRKHGEIYSYEKEGTRIVKVTDDQLQ